MNIQHLSGGTSDGRKKLEALLAKLPVGTITANCELRANVSNQKNGEVVKIYPAYSSSPNKKITSIEVPVGAKTCVHGRGCTSFLYQGTQYVIFSS